MLESNLFSSPCNSLKKCSFDAKQLSLSLFLSECNIFSSWTWCCWKNSSFGVKQLSHINCMSKEGSICFEGLYIWDYWWHEWLKEIKTKKQTIPYCPNSSKNQLIIVEGSIILLLYIYIWPPTFPEIKDCVPLQHNSITYIQDVSLTLRHRKHY